MHVIPEPFEGGAPFGIPEDKPLAPERPEPSSGPVRGLVLDDIYRTQGPRLLRRFRRRADQDLLHDTFVRVAKIDLETRDAIESIPAYLTRIAPNLLWVRGKVSLSPRYFSRSRSLESKTDVHYHFFWGKSQPMTALAATSEDVNLTVTAKGQITLRRDLLQHLVSRHRDSDRLG